MIGSGDVCKWPVVAAHLSRTMKLTEEQAVDIVELVASFGDPTRGKVAFDRCESPAERLFLTGGSLSNDYGIRIVFPPDTVTASYEPLQLVGQIDRCDHPTVPWLFQQFEVAGYRADFCIPCSRLLIEIDGHDFHSSRQQLAADKKRDRDLAAADWRVLRFTGSQIYANPAACFREMFDIAIATLRPLEHRSPIIREGHDLSCLVSPVNPSASAEVTAETFA